VVTMICPQNQWCETTKGAASGLQPENRLRDLAVFRAGAILRCVRGGGRWRPVRPVCMGKLDADKQNDGGTVASRASNFAPYSENRKP